jgi:hypothetical protein
MLPSKSFVLGTSFYSFTGITVLHSWSTLHSDIPNFFSVPHSLHKGFLFSSFVWHFQLSILGGLSPGSIQKSGYSILEQHVDWMKSTGCPLRPCSHMRGSSWSSSFESNSSVVSLSLSLSPRARERILLECDLCLSQSHSSSSFEIVGH